VVLIQKYVTELQVSDDGIYSLVNLCCPLSAHWKESYEKRGKETVTAVCRRRCSEVV